MIVNVWVPMLGGNIETAVDGSPSPAKLGTDDRGAATRAPLAFCLLCFAFLGHFLSALISLLHYFGERVAATEPDLRGGTAGRKRKK